jgi:hypothetical protein
MRSASRSIKPTAATTRCYNRTLQQQKRNNDNHHNHNNNHLQGAGLSNLVQLDVEVEPCLENVQDFVKELGGEADLKAAVGARHARQAHDL